MKVVLDANMLLAALATRGMCEAVLELCLAEHELYLSSHLLTEVKNHLADKFRLSPARIAEIIQFLQNNAHWVEPVKVPAKACRDADDLPVLGTALAAGAEVLVTGDRDLLELKKYQGVPILSPREFYERANLR